MDHHRNRLLLLATIVYLGVLLLSHTVTSGANPLPAWLNPGVAIISAQLLLILAPALIFAWLVRLPFRDTFKLYPLSGRQAAKSLAVGMLSWPAFIFLGILTTLLVVWIRPEALSGAPGGAGQPISPWVLFLSVVLVAPLCEEFFFRGLLLSVYTRHFGLGAVGIVGILFGLLHLGIDQILGAICIGCLAGWLVLQTRSIWAGVLVHMGANLMSGLLVLALSFATQGAELVPETPAEVNMMEVLLLGMLVWGLIALVCLVPAGLILRSLNPRRSQGGFQTAAVEA